MAFKTDFTLPTQGTGSFSLSAHKGQIVVLYFYPRDDTSGCTLQAEGFRDAHTAFRKAGAVVVGLSRDTVKSHDKFAKKLGLPFAIAADPDEAVCTQYGVMKAKTMYGKPVRGIERSTFVFDRSGALVKEWRGVKVPGHVDEVLAFVKTLPKA